MTAKSIVRKYLKENGYTGLVGDDCGCEINDLMPCDTEGSDCQPGYKHICKKCGQTKDCELFSDGSRYCISISKKEPDRLEP